MEANSTLRQYRTSIGPLVTFIVALLAAFLLGGLGGYLARGVTSPATPSHVTAPPLKSTPEQTFMPNGFTNQGAQPTMPMQTQDPNGFTIQY